MSLLEITNLSHSFSENVLYKNADFSLNKGEHVGIVGQNGTGKSTLIKLCTGQLLPDDGRVTWQSKTSIGYLDQYAEINLQLDMKSFLKTAFLNLYDLEEKMNYLYENMQEGDFQNLNTAARYQEELERQDFYLIDTKIEQVATGLGLLAIGLDRPIAQMSGGQRAKVILAKLLLEKPDVLLLDEPTNFLDKEHVDWLSEYLCGLNNAFMVVSHDYAFLEKISNRICDIDNHKITKYYGTYSEFLRKKKNPCQWSSTVVVDVLERMDYLGHTVNFKTHRKSYKQKKKIENDKSEWKIFENTHEPIIDKSTFDIVQKIRANRKRPTKMGEMPMFSGILYCADCGKKLSFHRRANDPDTKHNFVCSNYRSILFQNDPGKHRNHSTNQQTDSHCK